MTKDGMTWQERHERRNSSWKFYSHVILFFGGLGIVFFETVTGQANYPILGLAGAMLGVVGVDKVNDKLTKRVAAFEKEGES